MALLFCLASCNLAPRSERPVMPISNHYKEAGTWVQANPSLATIKKNCPWWTVYHDETLNSLEQKLTNSNPSLQSYYARFQEARALVQAARSQLYPTILGLGGQSRQQNSETIANVYPTTRFLYNTATVQALLSYEIDAWGEIRNTVSASTHAARASEFDLAAMDLSLHTMLADVYFQLRGDDQIQVALDRVVKAYEHALYLVHQLHEGGAFSAYEEDLAVNQLENAKTAATDMRLQRAELEHAIAVLVGDIPANFHLPPMTAHLRFVPVSPDLPSTLLERRPDVAAVAQRVQAANAVIGIARAAFFPTLNLSALAGYQGQKISSLFSNPSLIWALGPPSGMNMFPPEVSQVIFDGYYLQANLKRAKASYYETVNNYRQTVLTAFQDVEDSLVATDKLNQEMKTQLASTKAANRALYQVRQRMRDGMDTYLGVVQVENEALQSKIALINIRTSRQLASVHLIKALGGGWTIEEAMKQPI
ncbi:MAG: efflux transporter outer membrane subunit [Legionellaceae bacterium]|nr:efflux transporter outer membrane subunit [Legionellaceae bacterium]